MSKHQNRPGLRGMIRSKRGADRNNVVGPNGELYLNDHGRPVTRRQLLGQGFLAGGAMIVGGSLLGLFGRSARVHAQAADCGLTAAPVGSIPFITLELAGGANIAGSNVMVGGPGGQRDFLPEEAYRKLGLAPNTFDQLDESMGLAFHADSALLRGIRSKAPAGTLSNVNGAIFPQSSANDTGNNPSIPLYGIARAGGRGELVTLIGTRNSDSGVRSKSPDYMIDAAIQPTKVDRPEDARSLVDAGRLGEILAEADDSASVLTALEKLSQLKLDKVREQRAIRDLMSCSYVQSREQLARFSDPAALDATADPMINGNIFSQQELNRSHNNIFRKTASVMKLVVEGFAGAGAVEVGGYDYHTGNRSVGEERDFVAGQAIGAMLQFAALKATPLMIHVCSDGSVVSNGRLDESEGGRGKGEWTSDRSTTAAALLLAYNPGARPQMIANQIGYFNPDGFINRQALSISDNVTLMTEAVVANYLALSGNLGMFAQIFPQSALGSGSQLDPYIAFQAI